MVNNNYKKNISAFTLLEVLVAVSILMMAVVAPITIVQKGLSSAVYSKNQMIASYLIQDAIEYIKNKRDESAMIDGNWNNFLSDFNYCVGDNNWCALNTIDGAVLADENLFLDKDNNKYTYNIIPPNPTHFKRRVNIIVSQQDRNEALITAEVSWDNNKIVVKNLLYNI